jgi:energy-coupling factor transport system ATP-binding protein
MALMVEKLCHIYSRGEPDEVKALSVEKIKIEPGEFVVIAGNSGSGKSTLLRYLAGLMKPTSGKIFMDDIEVRKTRDRIGLAVQSPERALFEKTLYDDVAFGLRNQCHSDSETRAKALDAIRKVGLDEALLTCSPRSLSHGQKRLAALAGVIALEPRYLFLDEPTAGLDTWGRHRVIDALARLNRDGMTIVAASHNMAHFSEVVSRLVILESGKIWFDGEPDGLVSAEGLESLGLSLPPSLTYARELLKRGIAVKWDVEPEKLAGVLGRTHESRV